MTRVRFMFYVCGIVVCVGSGLSMGGESRYHQRSLSSTPGSRGWACRPSAIYAALYMHVILY